MLEAKNTCVRRYFEIKHFEIVMITNGNNFFSWRSIIDFVNDKTQNNNLLIKIRHSDLFFDMCQLIIIWMEQTNEWMSFFAKITQPYKWKRSNLHTWVHFHSIGWPCDFGFVKNEMGERW